MLNSEEAVGEFLEKTQLHVAILRIMRQFPGHTFWQRAASQYVMGAIENRRRGERAVEDFVIPLMKEIENCHPVLRGAVYVIVTHVRKMAEKDIELAKYLLENDGWKDFWENQMKDRMKIIADGYGGKC
jgi:aspartate/methionine/tyrosine aminotransferase